MLKRVLQILLLVAVVMLCYYVVLWVLSLLGITIPHQILVVILVILGLSGAIAIISGRADNITWWGP